MKQQRVKCVGEQRQHQAAGKLLRGENLDGQNYLEICVSDINQYSIYDELNSIFSIFFCFVLFTATLLVSYGPPLTRP